MYCQEAGRSTWHRVKGGEEEEEGFNWVGGKGLVDFYYGYNVLRVMLCYALTRGVLGGCAGDTGDNMACR